MGTPRPVFAPRQGLGDTRTIKGAGIQPSSDCTWQGWDVGLRAHGGYGNDRQQLQEPELGASCSLRKEGEGWGHGAQGSPGIPYGTYGCSRQPRCRALPFGEHTALTRGAAESPRGPHMPSQGRICPSPVTSMGLPKAGKESAAKTQPPVPTTVGSWIPPSGAGASTGVGQGQGTHGRYQPPSPQHPALSDTGSPARQGAGGGQGGTKLP